MKLRPSRLAPLALLASCCAAAVPLLMALFGAPPAAATAPAVVISAHRGGAGQWPQNSLLAFSNSLAAGYDEIEGDTWITEDGSHVIYHDATISAARCGGPYAGRTIWSLTMAQVRTIRCNGQPIPTEAELLSLIRSSSNTRTVLRLETKSYPGQSAASASDWAYRVGKQVVDAGLTARAVMQDFDWAGIAGYHRASNSLRVSALTTSVTTAEIDRAAELGAYDLSYEGQFTSSALNAALVTHHLVPTVWGIDQVPESPGPPSASVVAAAEKAYTSAACSGVKVVITNYPGLLTAYRSKVTCPS